MKRVNTLLAIFYLLSGALLASPPVFAGKLDLLLMPGELIAGHAKFEEDCEKCHETLQKGNQSARCLACHDHADIKADIDSKQGFHGRLDPRQAIQCSHCHTDHEGRDKRIVVLDTEAFDHRQTDFALQGAHQKLACDTCHTPARKKFSQAPSNCHACHQKDDAHRGELGEECGKCHVEESWKQQKFDHDRDTDYKLIGRHAELACELCHPNQRYTNTPRNCYSCHLINDVHNGLYGERCEKCHTSRKWSALSFNHAVDTRYPLTGLHRQVKCEACHSVSPYKQKTDSRCFACHAKDDEHKGRNGKDCGSCHATKGWRAVAFDHAKDTGFALKGKHQGLVCAACHRSASMGDLKDSTCAACHRADDVHKGNLGEQCASCHNETGWNDKVFFDHDLTRFPLIGLHAIASCEACHLNAEYRDTDVRCNTCHKAEDVHAGRFGEKCNDCHTPNGWRLWQFDHDKQTDYPLRGKHRELHCNNCHRSSLDQKDGLSTQCYGCHRIDDVHRGSFGRRCERCHNPESFKNPVIH